MPLAIHSKEPSDSRERSVPQPGHPQAVRFVEDHLPAKGPIQPAGHRRILRRAEDDHRPPATAPGGRHRDETQRLAAAAALGRNGGIPPERAGEFALSGPRPGTALERSQIADLSPAMRAIAQTDTQTSFRKSATTTQRRRARRPARLGGEAGSAPPSIITPAAARSAKNGPRPAAEARGPNHLRCAVWLRLLQLGRVGRGVSDAPPRQLTASLDWKGRALGYLRRARLPVFREYDHGIDRRS
eukprot:gene11902-biopygen12409